ncbi:MAG: N-acetyltransferase [Pseudonocardiaceae bacterium]|nr:MAG: N-acetyltransferase [Pseudonocardiaceae bacterium]
MTATDVPLLQADTLTLAALRATGDRAVAWAEAAGGTTVREPGLVLADALSPCLFLNVAVAEGPPDVERIAAFFPSGRPFLLVSAAPTADLTPSGLMLMGHPPFMVRPAADGVVAPPRGVTVEEVTGPASLAEWDHVLADGYPAPHSPAPPALLGGPTRFWLARLDGRPVAAALSHTAHDVVSVEAVATLPDARGRGIGAAVTHAATVADPAAPAVLIASDAGVGVYRGLGYLPVTRWTLWFRP